MKHFHILNVFLKTIYVKKESFIMKILKNKFIIISILTISISTIALIKNNYFLSKNNPIDTETLVIEGWLPASDLELLVNNYDLSKYKNIFITGVAHNHPYHLLNNNSTLVNELVYNHLIKKAKTQL
jgi:hypothetical protein